MIEWDAVPGFIYFVEMAPFNAPNEYARMGGGISVLSPTAVRWTAPQPALFRLSIVRQGTAEITRMVPEA